MRINGKRFAGTQLRSVKAVAEIVQPIKYLEKTLLLLIFCLRLTSACPINDPDYQMFNYTPPCNTYINTETHVAVFQHPPNDGNLFSIPLMNHFVTNNPDSNARIPSKIRLT